MKRLSMPFYPFFLIFTFAFMSFMCKKDVVNTVAFEATYTTSNELIDPPPLLKQRITGLGKSNELNISKFVAISTQNTGTPPPFKLSGPCTYYADNGDVFYSEFTGTATPNAEGTITVQMTHTITGGTGKFAHASGSLAGITYVDPKMPTASISCKGTISY